MTLISFRQWIKVVLDFKLSKSNPFHVWIFSSLVSWISRSHGYPICDCHLSLAFLSWWTWQWTCTVSPILRNEYLKSLMDIQSKLWSQSNTKFLFRCILSFQFRFQWLELHEDRNAWLWQIHHQSFESLRKFPWQLGCIRPFLFRESKQKNCKCAALVNRF